MKNKRFMAMVLSLMAIISITSCGEKNDNNSHAISKNSSSTTEKDNELEVSDEMYSGAQIYENNTDLTYENVVQLILSSVYSGDYASFNNLIPPVSRRYYELEGMDDYEDMFSYMCKDFEENGVYGDAYGFAVLPDDEDIDYVYDTYAYLDEICGNEYSDYESGKIDKVFEISFSMKSNVEDIAYVNYGCYIVVQNGIPYFEYCESSECSLVYEKVDNNESSSNYEDGSTLFDTSLLKTANLNAKTAYNAINFALSDMIVTGDSIADGLYFYDLSDVADDVLSKAISEEIDNGMVCYSIDSGELSFVQWKDNINEKYIGQYPEIPDINTNVTWGVFSKD